MRTTAFLVGFLTLALLVPLGSASAYLLDEIGEQDFFVHQAAVHPDTWNAAQIGEPALTWYHGNDIVGPNGDVTWTHTFTPPGPTDAVYLEIGTYDFDSGTVPQGGVRDVVAGLWFDGVLQNDSFFTDAGPADQVCVGIFATTVPWEFVSDGSLTVRLRMDAPGLGGEVGVNNFYTTYNGVGFDFVRLSAEPGAPTINLSVCSAALKWMKQEPNLGKVHLRAAFDADLPGAEDVVAVYLDGIELLAAPFSHFHQDSPTEPYVLAGGGLVVRLDFVEGMLFVVTPKITLADLDPSDGVDVELWLGDAVGVENIPMTENPGDRLVYIPPDCECGGM